MRPLFVKFSQNWIKASKQFTKMANISGFSPHAKKNKNKEILRRHPIFKFLYPGWRQCQVSEAPQSYSVTVSV